MITFVIALFILTVDGRRTQPNEVRSGFKREPSGGWSAFVFVQIAQEAKLGIAVQREQVKTSPPYDTILKLAGLSVQQIYYCWTESPIYKLSPQHLPV